MQVTFDTRSLESYRQFLSVKKLPHYRIQGRVASFPDEYAAKVGITSRRRTLTDYTPPEWMFDYQQSITTMAIRKEKYAVFADCGLGKTCIILDFARYASDHSKGGILIVSPLNVISQTIDECRKFYGDALHVEQVRAKGLQQWLNRAEGIGITNYEALTEDLKAGNLAGLILDESSMLKSHYGKWASVLLRLGRGLRWKLCCTGTPAPNDRIEYANHAVFLDKFSTVNAFLATYFVNRGQTQERWTMKPHALRPFYRSLSAWCIFLTDPRTYGWHDNTESIPPIYTQIHEVPMTQEQRSALKKLTGKLFATQAGGITTRGKLGQLGKGMFNGQSIPTNKPQYIHDLIRSWPDESTITWCIYNEEQAKLQREFSDAASITGSTKLDERLELIHSFQSGDVKHMISKPKILGFGLNLQIATRQVFSGLQDSYESYYQAVKRSNRYGSIKPLNVHLPITEIEEPMVQNVLRKADRVQKDTEEQEQLFKELAYLEI